MSKLYKNLLRPILFRFSTETAHEFGISAMRIGMGSDLVQKIAGNRFAASGLDKIERFGLEFSSPFGMAAGFDKNGVVVNQLASLGFGFVEVGTVTFQPQPGNEKPRLFRLPKDQAIINRLGFNNHGAEEVVTRLKKIDPKCILGVNIGKNKDVENEDAIGNYLKSFDLAFEVADYIAVNVSSPNTPNLRELQKAESLELLLGELQKRNRRLSGVGKNDIDEKPKPLLVKIAPDLDEGEINAIVDIAQRLEITGIIATNTTIGRSGLVTEPGRIKEIGSGGLSGKPVRKRATEVISSIYKFSGGKLPIIGVGGIFTAEDAFEKICAGASLIQGYTGFIYQGISYASEINCGLSAILKEKGFRNLDEAIGTDVKL
ncbi:MAG: quinone-dependent dihydroorotate dehydrogenase [Acidobacteria bacterium]|nr:quinone-dependent dihydroorotate dehydrogenase [Acidobacteriota bacterium]